MSKIIARNKQYNGISATVQFTNGVGYTTNPHLIEWFRTTGYTVEEETPNIAPMIINEEPLKEDVIQDELIKDEVISEVKEEVIKPNPTPRPRPQSTTNRPTTQRK